LKKHRYIIHESSILDHLQQEEKFWTLEFLFFWGRGQMRSLIYSPADTQTGPCTCLLMWSCNVTAILHVW